MSESPHRRWPRPRRERFGGPANRRDFGWGFLDQALASASTFALTLVMAREFGPAGVGAMVVPYAAFLVALGLQRAVLVDPYLTRVPGNISDERALSATISLSLAIGAVTSIAFVAVGVFVGGPVGAAFIAFSPWIIPALMQALLRSATFRDSRGSVAVVASGLMLVIFVLMVAAGLRGNVTSVVAAWGTGAVVSAGWLIVIVRARPAHLALATHWWRSESMHFGAWLVSGVVVWSACSYGLLVGLAAILGTEAVGGYRAIESVFSPLSLLAPALSNPGLKAMRDSWRITSAMAFRLAVRLSTIGVIGTATYALAVGLGRDAVFYIYGDAFRPYAALIAPIAVGQVFIAGAIGFVILLKVARRGRDAVVAGAAGPVIALAIGVPLGAYFGLTVAAWAIAFSFLPPLYWAVRRATAATHNNDSALGNTQHTPRPVRV